MDVPKCGGTGGWNLEGKRRWWKSVSCRMRWKGTFVDLDGGSRHEQVEAKLSRRGREMLNEGEEIRSPKRKVLRVDSEET